MLQHVPVLWNARLRSGPRIVERAARIMPADNYREQTMQRAWQP